MQPTDFGDYQLGEFLTRFESLNFHAVDDNHPDLLCECKRDKEVRPIQMLRFSGDSICCNENSKIKASMLDLGEKPRDLLAPNGGFPAFALNKKIRIEGAQASRILIVTT